MEYQALFVFFKKNDKSLNCGLLQIFIITSPKNDCLYGQRKALCLLKSSYSFNGSAIPFRFYMEKFPFF